MKDDDLDAAHSRRRPRRQRIARWGLAVALLAGGISPPGFAQETTAERWLGELRQANELLGAAKFAEAREASVRLVDELAGSLKGGDGANELAATALAQLALAEAGLGRTDEAVWHLQMAEAFNPGFKAAPFTEFGAAGAALAEARRSAAADPAPSEIVEIAARPDLTPPRVVESPHVVFRASREVLEALDPALRVEFLIDSEGRAGRPVVKGRLDNPGAVLLSLEVLRAWRFTTPRIDGEPAVVRYAVDLPLTRGAARRAEWDLHLGAIACLLSGERWAEARDAARGLIDVLSAAPPSRDQEAASELAQTLLATAQAQLGA